MLTWLPCGGNTWPQRLTFQALEHCRSGVLKARSSRVLQQEVSFISSSSPGTLIFSPQDRCISFSGLHAPASSYRSHRPTGHFLLTWRTFCALRTAVRKLYRPFAMTILTKRHADSSVGRLIRDNVIPTLHFLSERIDFSLGNLFSTGLLLAVGVDPGSKCGDLAASDCLFEALPSK